MFNLNNSEYKIILASQSPRRQFLLKEAGLDFDVVTIAIDEEFPPHLRAEEIALWIAHKKAMAFDFGELPENALIITADTVVWIDGQSIGKPSNEEEAKNMLRFLSGKSHTVSTGVYFRTSSRTASFFVNTIVWFRDIEDKEIDYYIEKYKPLDKAGAYGIQEWIGYVGVERIEGSFYNVMGLPVQTLYIELQNFMAQPNNK